MLKKDHGKIHVRRRDFLKTAAVAGMAATLPVTGMYKQDPETINSWYNRKHSANHVFSVI